MSDHAPLICVVGPTATGKSELAQEIAKILGSSILSADSMQIYRGMDIGTAKVPIQDREVSYFGIDLINPGEPYSAALYQAYARNVIKEQRQQNSLPVLVGGTGFYIKAVIDDMDFAEGEQINNSVREKYWEIFKEKGAHALWEMLNIYDPLSASVIHENDVKRVIRAFELLDQGDNYYSRLNALGDVKEYIPSLQIGISVDPDLLRSRIDSRVDIMREAGLVDEVESLLEQGFRDGITAPQAIGYKEIVSAFDGEITLDQAFEQIKTSTKRYAKRQRTWFRKDKRIHWIEYDFSNPNALFEKAMELVGSKDI